jgi:hypothetical protein
VIIEGLRRAAPPAPPRLRPGTGGFALSFAADRPAGPAATAATMPLDCMLALQEQTEDVTRDRQARQHGHTLLQALAALQHSLLQGAGEIESLQKLAALLANAPAAADPALAAILQGITVRAQVELARHGL